MPVDMNSTKSVRHALFESLQLAVPNSRRTRTGKVKTDADVSVVQICRPSCPLTVAHLLAPNFASLEKPSATLFGLYILGILSQSTDSFED